MRVVESVDLRPTYRTTTRTVQRAAPRDVRFSQVLAESGVSRTRWATTWHKAQRARRAVWQRRRCVAPATADSDEASYLRSQIVRDP
jgi:hypothetical protein